MGFCQPLFVLFPAPLPVTGVLLPPMYPSGAGFAVFRPVGTGDESRPALGAPLHADAAEYLRFQRLVLWQYRPAEPLAADGIGNRLWADTFLTIVQQQAVAVIVVTAGFPNKGVCPSALCRGHAWQAAARCALYLWWFFTHAFLRFFIFCRSPRKPFLPHSCGVSRCWYADLLRAKLTRSDFWTFCPEVAALWRASPAGNISFGRSFTCACPSMN